MTIDTNVIKKEFTEKQITETINYIENLIEKLFYLGISPEDKMIKNLKTIIKNIRRQLKKRGIETNE